MCEREGGGGRTKNAWGNAINGVDKPTVDLESTGPRGYQQPYIVHFIVNINGNCCYV